MKKIKNQINLNYLLGFIIIILFATILYKFSNNIIRKNIDEDNSGSSLIPVEVAVVKKGDINLIRVYTSNIEAEQSIDIKPKISGQVKRIFVEMGDKVSKGQPIAQLDDSDALQFYQQKKAIAEVVEASLKKANIEKENKKRELMRMQSLFEKKLISQKELDKADAEYKNAEINYLLQQAELNQKIAEVKQAKILFDDTVIKAPFSGFIASRYVENGAFVSPNTVISTLVSIENVKAKIDVDEKDLIMLYENMPVKIEVESFPNRNFEGYIERISPVLDNNTHLGKVQIKISNPNKILKPGMFVKIRISIKSQSNALIIPTSGVINKDGKDIVYIAKEGKALEKEVKLGVSDDERIEVVKGLSEGDWIIIAGQQSLQDGDQIIVKKKI